jgi:hypothetical protein
MSPRIIDIPLSGGNRKAQDKGIRQAHGIHARPLPSIGPDPQRRRGETPGADRLEREAGNAIMWAGGPAMPSPGEPQAEPTIGKAINGGYDPAGGQVQPVRPGFADPAAVSEAPTGDPGLEAGGGALLRALQRRAALRPTSARTHPRADPCSARSGAAEDARPQERPTP